MKQSGIDWVGEIPDDWKINQLTQIVSQVKHKNKELKEKNLLSLSYGKIKRKDINTNDGLLPASFDGYNIICDGDIVLRLTDLQNDHTSLRVGRATEQGIITSAYTTLHPVDYDNSKYLYYILHSFDLIKGFYGMGSGVRQGLNYDEVKTLKVPPPPKATQQRIAEYLDKKVLEIDSIIEESKKSIEEYKAWKQSVIFEAVTGKNLNCKKKDSGIEWIGEIPEEWKITTIKQLYNVTLGKMIAPKQTSDLDTLENYLCAANIKWLGVNTEVNKQMYFNDLEKEEYLLISGDVLLMEGGLAGTACIYQNEFSPCYMQNSVLRCRCKTIGYNKYLYYWIFAIYHLGYIDSICNRATIQHYTKEKVENTPILVNAISEQESIAKMLDSKCAQIDSLIAEKESLIADLTEYKKSLIFEVVTGKRSL